MPAAPHNNNATAQRSCRNVEKINQEIKQIRKVPSINYILVNVSDNAVLY